MTILQGEKINKNKFFVQIPTLTNWFDDDDGDDGDDDGDTDDADDAVDDDDDDVHVFSCTLLYINIWFCNKLF